MSLLLSRLSRLRLGKPASVRSSVLILSNGFSSSSLQTPPCSIICANPCGAGLGKLVILNANESDYTDLEKKVPMELVDSDPMVTIGASHGWVATLKEDGILRLQDDLNPYASDTNPKRISLPPLVTLPRCQTQIVTNVSMSLPSPEDEDCVVAVKFLGPQLSFCRPAKSNSEWTNIKIANPSFFSSRVMFSKKDEMFRIPGSGGHLIGSWDLRTEDHNPKIQRLRFRNLPELPRAKRELLDSCYRSEHLVESQSTGELFLVKRYKKATTRDTVKMKTQGVMVFKLDEKGNAVYTQDIGDLCIFLSKSEPFCSSSSRFPNYVDIYDVDEVAFACLEYDDPITGVTSTNRAPYHIPPQNID
ncbi:hypothetical protein AtNW77_Chr5g0139881 [Arabidopsis thaliana]|uniref:KIB1-4 beta-propeller domain-containing protein n=4 Tax=Arabidopsis TaxID=3701 RepID=Q9FIU9_ARATH|nr:hypothetical protein (DUF295) [Arabidopsis thaliana]KAG7606070.1 hypothetical protein ISN45_At05g050240 [Arabidopsis thaliana x Arabidopsis arenosa]KAG7612981.1 hypothetical protein ISN44_As05g049510 [Arabidopsis suecica]AED96509.1 hypothetical protein (DUF295) [Arabidopsis thaliana]OAO89677.1 hypothetical protein AXX17_AT5G53630 [Arabidopsis thaliana]CAA0409797.1 unnamed protein product [Arabidopsis thaliana]|eukprot:NP_200266.1 hypothetical protein (DUF295) [Arabidopsis thaliana]